MTPATPIHNKIMAHSDVTNLKRINRNTTTTSTAAALHSKSHMEQVLPEKNKLAIHEDDDDGIPGDEDEDMDPWSH
jgi:hypothetical protein